jgi:5-methylcytosine-specific restriction endonuclease McrA
MRVKLSLKKIADAELLSRLFKLLEDSRRVESELIAHVAEVDARKLYAREGASSMFAYCTEALHLSEAEAWLRIRVARASRKHPMVLEMLAAGRLHLSAIVVLAPHLTPENAEALLKRAVHKSKRQVEELVAEIAPREDAPSVLRKLPGSSVSTTGSQPQLTPDSVEEMGHRLNPEAAGDVERGRSPDAVGASAVPDGGEAGSRSESRGFSEAAEPDRPIRPAQRSATVVPIAPERFKVQFTADAELRDQLERLRALTRSAVPDGDIGKVIALAVSRELQRLEARRFAKTKAPRRALADTDTSPRSRRIPAAVRRTVHRRDGGRCTYRDRHGRRCTRRHDLEFHHRMPFAQGGSHAPENLALLCRAHNALLAEQDYGKEVMKRHRRESTAADPSAAAGMRGAAPGSAPLRNGPLPP